MYNIKKHEWKKVTSPNTPAPRSAQQCVAVDRVTGAGDDAADGKAGAAAAASTNNAGELWMFGGEFVSPSQSVPFFLIAYFSTIFIRHLECVFIAWFGVVHSNSITSTISGACVCPIGRGVRSRYGLHLPYPVLFSSHLEPNFDVVHEPRPKAVRLPARAIAWCITNASCTSQPHRSASLLLCAHKFCCTAVPQHCVRRVF